jgi:hypothetical protein
MRAPPKEPALPSHELLLAGGSGPLLQRDYWAVVHDCRMSPAEVGALLAERFCDFAPPDLARFWCAREDSGPLEVGDELGVAIRLVGTFGVRVVHKDAQSLTLGTLRGHPEVGRITFGAYRNDWGQVVVHIRSRARSSDRAHYAGFLVVGEAMQTNTWTQFLDRLAATVGEGVVGSISEDLRRIDHPLPDPLDEPTFEARGD